MTENPEPQPEHIETDEEKIHRINEQFKVDLAAGKIPKSQLDGEQPLDNIHEILARDRKIEWKKRRRILAAIGAVGAIALLGLAIKGCSDNKPPVPPPTLTPQPTEQLPQPTETPFIPTATPTASPTEVVPTPTATPQFRELDFYVDSALTADKDSDTIWEIERNDASIQFSDASPNELNDIATSASEFVLVEAGKSPAEACILPVGPFKKAGPLTLEAIADILEGKEIRFAPELTRSLRPDILRTAGADLSCQNNRTMTDPAYQSAMRANDQLKGLYAANK